MDRPATGSEEQPESAQIVSSSPAPDPTTVVQAELATDLEPAPTEEVPANAEPPVDVPAEAQSTNDAQVAHSDSPVAQQLSEQQENEKNEGEGVSASAEKRDLSDEEDSAVDSAAEAEEKPIHRKKKLKPSEFLVLILISICLSDEIG